MKQTLKNIDAGKGANRAIAGDPLVSKSVFRYQARIRGEASYFEPFACEHGHIAPRSTRTSRCLVCVFDATPPIKRKGNRPHDLAPKLQGAARAAFFASFSAQPRMPVSPRKEYKTFSQMQSAEKDRRRLLLRTNPVAALKMLLRARIAACVAQRGFVKGAATADILGCTWEFFAAHIERQFLPGMSWGNRRLWHIDHIVPMATARTVEDVLALNHFTNLRPLWAVDNVAKGATITHLI